MAYIFRGHEITLARNRLDDTHAFQGRIRLEHRLTRQLKLRAKLTRRRQEIAPPGPPLADGSNNTFDNLLIFRSLALRPHFKQWRPVLLALLHKLSHLWSSLVYTIHNIAIARQAPKNHNLEIITRLAPPHADGVIPASAFRAIPLQTPSLSFDSAALFQACFLQT